MKFQRIQPNIEVYFDNGHHVGTIIYDDLWNQWRIEFTKGTRLSFHYLKDIQKYMKRL